VCATATAATQTLSTPSGLTIVVVPSFTASRTELPVLDTTLGTNFVLDTASVRASDGGAVRTSWSVLQRPEASWAQVTGIDPRVQFRPDQLGLYKLLVRVEDARGAYSEAVVSIHARYLAPATAGVVVTAGFVGETVAQAPISASLGSVFAFDTSTIRAPDDTVVSKAWQILEQPAGSRAQLSGSGERYQFTPDVLGTYRLKVRVQDVRGGWGDTVYTLSVLNRPPEANAAVNATPVAAISYSSARVQSRASLSLRGGASFDADGDPLSYNWSLSSAPAGSTASLGGVSGVDTSITFDADGDFSIVLRVTDSKGAYSDRQVTIKVGEAPPVVVYDHNNWTSLVGSPATANVGYSHSPQGKPLTYLWTMDARPAGSAAAIAAATSAQLAFVPDLPGQYVASVVVSDGTLKSSASFNLRALSDATRTTELPFRPFQMRYSKGSDQLVMLGTEPNLITFVDVFSGLVRSIPLPSTPKTLSVSPDGKLALVLYGSVIDLFDVSTGQRIRTTSLGAVRSDALLLNSGETILFGGSRSSGGDEPSIMNARTGSGFALVPVWPWWMFSDSELRGLFSDRLGIAFTVPTNSQPARLTALKLNFTGQTTAISAESKLVNGSDGVGPPIAFNSSQSLMFDAFRLVVKTGDLTFAGKLDVPGVVLNVTSSTDDTELLALFVPYTAHYNGLAPSSYASLDPQTFFVRTNLNLPSINGQQSYGLALFHSAADRHVGVVQTGGDDAAVAGKRFWVFVR
jgi:PKD domain